MRALRTAMLVLAALAAPAIAGPSVMREAPTDARAVTARGTGNGRADDTAALQAAIDAASDSGKGGAGGGIVFLPAGRYRLTRTLFVWPGVRVFGVGRTRPVLLLAPSTPGFQQGVGTLVMFTGNRPGHPLPGQDGTSPVPVPPPTSVPFDAKIADANSGTFYSAMSNVDVEIGGGNPAAAAVRFHLAQHAFLSHMEFRLGSALAGIYQAGNFRRDLHFVGGRYGVLTEKTSPAWQYTLLDSTFEGQRDAAIREHEAQLTLANVTFRDVPVGVEIDQGYSDQLWGRDVRFERVARAGVVIGNEASAFTQVGFENAVASGTPTFARFRDSGRAVAGPGARYRVKNFTYGLVVPGLGRMGRFETRFDAVPLGALPAMPAAAVRALPPVASWANVRDIGAKGDNTADDTAALQRAIDGHRVLYFPAGFYRVTDTLKLRPDSVLIGLHPALTQIVLPDDTPAYRGVGSAKPLVESARGGNAIVSGIGLFTGGINPRATALLWRAGEASLVEDVKFQGGHGTDAPDGVRVEPYNANHSADPDIRRRWDGQHPSLWVTDGGGGSFVGLWSPDTYAQAGLYVSDTSTPGHVYQLSAEHHLRAEIVLDRVRHWTFLAPQTEEEAGESRSAVGVEMRDVHDVLFANYHGYRVTRSLQPAPAAVKLYGANDVRFRNVHVNAESGFATCDAAGCGTYIRASKYPFENAIVDATHGGEVREREFAALDVTPDSPAVRDPVLAPVKLLADGFGALGGGAADAAGRLYFIDRIGQRIHRWSKGEGLSIVADAPLDAINLAVDRSGELLVLSSAGPEATVLSLKPDGTGVTPIAATMPGRNARLVLPSSFWNNGEFRDQYDPATDRFTTLAEMFARDAAVAKARAYGSPDGSLALPAFRVWQQGPTDHTGWRFSDTLDTYGLVTAAVGERVHVANASEGRTYDALVGAGGALTDLKPFATRGGESVATGRDGRVYVANGQVFIYRADGSEAGLIDVPERPLQLVFGGAGGRTLFILTQHGLYAAEP